MARTRKVCKRDGEELRTVGRLRSFRTQDGPSVPYRSTALLPTLGPFPPRRSFGEETVVSYFQAIVIGLLQGVTEPFPVSSLGHSVLVPAWLGWDHLLASEAANESFYLSFLVGLH